MANIRTVEDMGAVFYDASTDKCYRRLDDQPTVGEATVSAGPSDILDYPDVSFDFDDTAPYQASWTSCERCVVEHTPQYKSDVEINDDDQGSYVTLFTAPANGELRIYSSETVSASDFAYFGFYINGAFHKDWTNDSDNDELSRGTALRLAAGDVVTLGADDDDGAINWGHAGVLGTVRCRFRPDTHP